MEPLDEIDKQMGWLSAFLQAAQQSSELNRKAAIRTAWAVGFGMVSSILGTLR